MVIVGVTLLLFESVFLKSLSGFSCGSPLVRTSGFRVKEEGCEGTLGEVCPKQGSEEPRDRVRFPDPKVDSPSLE